MKPGRKQFLGKRATPQKEKAIIHCYLRNRFPDKHASESQLSASRCWSLCDATRLMDCLPPHLDTWKIMPIGMSEIEVSQIKSLPEQVCKPNPSGLTALPNQETDHAKHRLSPYTNSDHSECYDLGNCIKIMQFKSFKSSSKS